jgi:hypothetical protein
LNTLTATARAGCFLLGRQCAFITTAMPPKRGGEPARGVRWANEIARASAFATAGLTEATLLRWHAQAATRAAAATAPTAAPIIAGALLLAALLEGKALISRAATTATPNELLSSEDTAVVLVVAAAASAFLPDTVKRTRHAFAASLRRRLAV